MMSTGKKILLTGASGWFGKSFILNYAARFSENALSELILVTSDGRDIYIPGLNSILKTIALYELYRIDVNVDVVIQSAFLTRDKITEYGSEEFRSINIDIIKTVSNYVETNKITTVFLISSGAVNDSDIKKDLYSELKKIEENTFMNVCDPMIFRVYGATGKLTPKASWSALSEFIINGKSSRNILIKSKGRVLRSYVSFDVLSDLIVEFIGEGKSKKNIIDACSECTDILTVAMSVSKIFDNDVDVDVDYDEENIVDSYIGNVDRFKKLCQEFKIYLPTLEEQILISSKSPFL